MKACAPGIKLYGGAPVLSSVYESTVPGLHFVGIASALSFGPAMRFVYGAKHPAATLAAHIRSSARQRSKAAVVPQRASEQSAATFNNR
jgi:hypothetical protein